MRSYVIILIVFLKITTINAKQEYKIFANVESIRKDNIITITSTEVLNREKYVIFNEKNIVGEIKILFSNKNENISNVKYRTIARYNINNKYKNIIKSGMKIGLVSVVKTIKSDYPDKRSSEKFKYKKEIKSKIDNRKMVLVTEGSFLFGTNNGEFDEYPEQKKILSDFYIDKYEVTNKEYYKYILATKVKFPKSWSGMKYKLNEADFPVLVSFKEAELYAKWAGKRLPTEEEWEKAANGVGYVAKIITPDGFLQILKKTKFPWGNIFSAEKCNSKEFWKNSKVGKNIKSKYKTGLLPVGTFEKYGNSAYNVSDMSGNAAEWTSSWYNAYNGNQFTENIRFGKQVKVIRGGAWYSSYENTRITARDYGGLPNLYEDNIAGFRCIKLPTKQDIKN